jgi:hypothetical protein
MKFRPLQQSLKATLFFNKLVRFSKLIFLFSTVVKRLEEEWEREKSANVMQQEVPIS